MMTTFNDLPRSLICMSHVVQPRVCELPLNQTHSHSTTEDTESTRPIDRTTCVRRQQAAGTFSRWLQPEVVAAPCVENEMASVLLNQRSIERNRPVNPLSRHHLRVSPHENGEVI